MPQHRISVDDPGVIDCPFCNRQPLYRFGDLKVIEDINPRGGIHHLVVPIIHKHTSQFSQDDIDNYIQYAQTFAPYYELMYFHTPDFRSQYHAHLHAISRPYGSVENEINIFSAQEDEQIRQTFQKTRIKCLSSDFNFSSKTDPSWLACIKNKKSYGNIFSLIIVVGGLLFTTRNISSKFAKFWK